MMAVKKNASDKEPNDESGVRADAARKRAGIVVPDASGAGLARWRGLTARIHGETGGLG